MDTICGTAFGVEVDSNGPGSHPTLTYATMISGTTSGEPTLSDKIKAYLFVFFLSKKLLS